MLSILARKIPQCRIDESLGEARCEFEREKRQRREMTERDRERKRKKPEGHPASSAVERVPWAATPVPSVVPRGPAPVLPAPMVISPVNCSAPWFVARALTLADRMSVCSVHTTATVCLFSVLCIRRPQPSTQVRPTDEPNVLHCVCTSPFVSRELCSVSVCTVPRTWISVSHLSVSLPCLSVCLSSLTTDHIGPSPKEIHCWTLSLLGCFVAIAVTSVSVTVLIIVTRLSHVCWPSFWLHGECPVLHNLVCALCASCALVCALSPGLP